MKFKVITDRGDFIVSGRNVNEARDYIEEKHVGITINEYREVVEEDAPKGKVAK